MATRQNSRNDVAVLFLTVIAYSFKPVASCLTGWFGDNCDLQCHCEDVPCKDSGDCENCAEGYFGPGCQYGDAVYRWSTDETHFYLYDHDDSTCNTFENETSILVGLSKQVTIYWIRFYVNDASKAAQFTIIVDTPDEGCKAQKKYFVTEFLVDINCARPVKANHLTVVGEIVSAMCSIYISEGRNIALKQPAKQSSTAQSFTADKAVDGVSTSSVNSGSCSSTDPGSNEWWSLAFPVPQIVFKINIVIDVTLPPEGYILKLLNAEGEVIIKYQEHQTKLYSVHEIMMNSTLASSSIRIEGSGSSSLTLCEVHIFAETVCPDDHFGLACAKTCSCRSSQICHLISGVCSEGCVEDAYGIFCDIPCSKSCLDIRCKQRSGKCLECKYGRRGDSCTEECPDGTYGYNCNHNCSTTCDKGLCDKVDGDCLACEADHYGPNCVACPENTHGANCSITCPKNCASKNCNSSTAECYMCVIGFHGPNCVACKDETYGENCSQSCAATCKDGCDTANGICVSCQKGSIGPYCSIIEQDTHTLLTIVIFGVLFSCIPGCMLFREKKIAHRTVDVPSSTSQSDDIVQ